MSWYHACLYVEKEGHSVILSVDDIRPYFYQDVGLEKAYKKEAPQLRRFAEEMKASYPKREELIAPCE